MNFVKERPLLFIGLLVLMAVGGALFFQKQIRALMQGKQVSNSQKTADVSAPTIIDGELVLPKVMLGKGSLSGGLKVGVSSTTLVGVYDEQSRKLVGMRIVGEMQNLSNKTIDGISPIIKFYDAAGSEIVSKVGRISTGFTLFNLLPLEKTLLDVTVEFPPESDKLEILLRGTAASGSAVFEHLKINGQEIEAKTAKLQQTQAGEDLQGRETGRQDSTNSAEASASAEENAGPGEMRYYTVTGKVVNSFSDPVTEVTVYAWVRNKKGEVFTWGRQDYPNDLISPGKSVDFRINLLPFKMNEEMETYEVAVWGKRYRF